MAKKKKEEAHENSERWLLSYSDFMTLLMIFFVVMYAMSSVDSQKYKKLSSSLSDSLGGGNAISSSSAGDTQVDTFPADSGVSSDMYPATDTAPGGTELVDLRTEIEEYVKQSGLTADVSTSITDRGLLISLRDSVAFDSGSAEVKESFRSSLTKIGTILKQTKAHIRIEGNTDNVPINTSQFKSNWELSTARATNVVQILISDAKVDSSKLSAVGYAEFRPMADNNTAENRKKNRRVDILVESASLDKLENK